MSVDRHLRWAGLALAFLIGLGSTATRAIAASPVGRWLGQDGHDLVGGNPGPSPNDYQDIHIALRGLPTDRDLAEVVIHGVGDGEWKLSSKNQFTVLVARQGRSPSADLYIEPYRRETGRDFEIKLTLDDGRVAEILVPGGKADPNLRAPGAGSRPGGWARTARTARGPGRASARTDSRTSTCRSPGCRASPRSSRSR